MPSSTLYILYNYFKLPSLFLSVHNLCTFKLSQNPYCTFCIYCHNDLQLGASLSIYTPYVYIHPIYTHVQYIVMYQGHILMKSFHSPHCVPEFEIKFKLIWNDQIPIFWLNDFRKKTNFKSNSKIWIFFRSLVRRSTSEVLP